MEGGWGMRNYRREANQIMLLGKWGYRDVASLVDSINELTERNEGVAEELGKALTALDRCQKRIAWYRNATMTETKKT